MEETLPELPQEIQEYLDVARLIDPLKVWDLLGQKPHPKQREVLEIVKSRLYSYLVLVNGRRWGKSFLTSSIVISDMLAPNASVLVVAPKFANAYAIFNETKKNILKLKLDIAEQNTKNMYIKLENGAKLRVVTDTSYESALSDRFSLIVFEETQSINNALHIYESILGPSQADFGSDECGFANSKTIFIGTARDETNDFYTLYNRAKSKKYQFECKGKTFNHYVARSYPTATNPYISKDFLARIKQELDEVTFKREYECVWTKGANEQLYYAFDRDKNVVEHSVILEKLKHPEHIQFYAGIDVGYAANTGYLLGFKEDFTGNFYIVGEYSVAQAPLETHYKGWVQLEEQFGVQKILRFLDPSATQTQVDLVNNYQYYTYPAFNPIDNGLEYVNTGFDKGKLLISENCTQLIDEIENLRWKNPNTKTIMISKKHKHFDLALASLRYLYASVINQEKNSTDFIVL